MALFGGLRTAPALAPLEALWQGSARSVAAPFGPILLFGARCRSSVVEHSIGNGEVDSSILSGSTSFSLENPFKISTKQRFRLNAGFSHFSYLGRNRPRKRVSTDTKLAAAHDDKIP
jgi:hypothetical protein